MSKNLRLLPVIGLLTLFCFAEEVRDVVIFTSGESQVGRVISMTDDRLVFTDTQRLDTAYYDMDQVYFIYNDFGRLLHYSRSLKQRLNIIEQYPGRMVTLAGDTVDYQTIYFDRRMLNPLVYTSSGDTAETREFPFLEISNVRMSSDRYDVSVKKGCLTGCSTILGLGGFNVIRYFFQEYQGGGIMGSAGFNALSKAAWHSAQDLLPEMPEAGINETGTLFKLGMYLVPLYTTSWIGYDWYFDKRTTYINPGLENREFPRDMFLFSLAEWQKKQIRRIWNPLSLKTLTVIAKIRQKFNKSEFKNIRDRLIQEENKDTLYIENQKIEQDRSIYSVQPYHGVIGHDIRFRSAEPDTNISMCRIIGTKVPFREGPDTTEIHQLAT